MQKGFALPLALAGLLLTILVAAGGYFFYQSKTKPVQNTSNPQDSTQPQIKDETANWKTYTNSEYKYSFKYPPEYSDPQIVLDNESPKFLHIWIKRTNPYIELAVISSMDDQKNDNCGELLNGSEGKEVIIAGIKGCKVFRNDSTFSYEALVKNNQYHFSVTVTALDKVALEDNAELFDKFLSTFKFLDDKTPNWKTYTNPQEKYSMDYPAFLFTDCSGDDGFFLMEGAEGTRDCGLGEEFTQFFVTTDFSSSNSYQKSDYEECYSVEKEPMIISGASGFKYSAVIKSKTGECGNQTVAYADVGTNIVLKHNNKDYHLYYYKNVETKIVEKMLASFKFLE